ncbi:MAG: cytochrome P450 [Acidimicrobiia bacterium]|jgi:cytochrome P450
MTTIVPETALTVDEIELGNPDTFLRDDLDAIFALLRRDRPVGFDAEQTPEGLPPGPGFWSFVRHRDMFGISRDYDSFTSVPAVGIFDYPVRTSIINMDPPVHTRYRLIVNRGFTPRMVGRLKENIGAQARRIVEEVAARGEGDLVTDIAAKLPGQVIATMLGVPFEDQEMVQRHTNAFIAPSDPEYGGTVHDMVAASDAIEDYAKHLGRLRREHPSDDVTSAIVNAEVPDDDGNPTMISMEDFAEFVKLLLVGGNETTRNAISHGVRLFQEHPEQKERFLADPQARAMTTADEILRYSTPVNLMRRTALRDIEVAGAPVKEGDKVVMWFRSGNYDDEAFEDPWRFDVTRTPNDHLTFGAGGPHYCLGANLAKVEIGVMLATLYQRLPDLEVTGPAVKMRAISSNGVKHLPVRWTPA